MHYLEGLVVAKEILEVAEGESAVEAVAVASNFSPVREFLVLQLFAR